MGGTFQTEPEEDEKNLFLSHQIKLGYLISNLYGINLSMKHKKRILQELNAAFFYRTTFKSILKTPTGYKS